MNKSDFDNLPAMISLTMLKGLARKTNYTIQGHTIRSMIDAHSGNTDSPYQLYFIPAKHLKFSQLSTIENSHEPRIVHIIKIESGNDLYSVWQCDIKGISKNYNYYPKFGYQHTEFEDFLYLRKEAFLAVTGQIIKTKEQTIDEQRDNVLKIWLESNGYSIPWKSNLTKKQLLKELRKIEPKLFIGNCDNFFRHTDLIEFETGRRKTA